MPDHPDIDHSIEAAAAFRTLSEPYSLFTFATVLRWTASLGHSNGDAGNLGDIVDSVAHALNASPALIEQHIMELSRARLVRIYEDSAGNPHICVNTGLVDRLKRIVDVTPSEAGLTDAR